MARTEADATQILVTGTIDGSNMVFTLSTPPTSNNYVMLINNLVYPRNSVVYPFSVKGTTVTYGNPLAADLAMTDHFLICY